ncbi:MAG: NINE protein [Cellvibrionaceae bacterium]|nr:NINE protein [Cellvibrionaceae bacterium]
MPKHCQECKSELSSGQIRCGQCGLIQEEFVYKSRVAAATLAIVAGMFGLHRFYLGKWWGVFYLLFFWTYIPALIGLIEGIVFLATDQKNWNAKYNQGLSAGSERGGVVIFVLFLPMFAVFGILAAVAIPAYHDYTLRTKVVAAHAEAKAIIPLVEEFAFENERWPMTEDLQLPALNNPLLAERRVEEGDIIINMAKDTGISGSFIYQSNSTNTGIKWSCAESTIEAKYLPQECRQ